jgi:hypothetical protein
MKRKKCLATTDHRRVYNIVLKALYADCGYCPWHANFWRNCTDAVYIHFFYEDGKHFRNYPNWKLVSKNRKQWMKKNFKKREEKMLNGTMYIEFYW